MLIPKFLFYMTLYEIFLETYQINTKEIRYFLWNRSCVDEWEHQIKNKSKNKLYHEYVKKDRQETDFCTLEESVRNLNYLILQTKTSYYENLGKKLNDTRFQSKTCWSILKSFYNGNRKPVIPPLVVNNKFVTDFKAKALFLMIFFQQTVYTSS